MARSASACLLLRGGGVKCPSIPKGGSAKHLIGVGAGDTLRCAHRRRTSRDHGLDGLRGGRRVLGGVSLWPGCFDCLSRPQWCLVNPSSSHHPWRAAQPLHSTGFGRGRQAELGGGSSTGRTGTARAARHAGTIAASGEELPRRCEEAAALRLALQVLQRASMQAGATCRRTAE
jgi:hypothetical protein